MQHITILCPSSIKKDRAVQDLINEYSKRILAKIDFCDLNVKLNTNDNDDLVKQKQGDAIMAHLDKMPKNTAIIALDERGKLLSSPALAAQIEQFELNGLSRLCFIIGGAFGLSQDVLGKVDFSLSLGHMVWPHRLVAVMILEQIYRAQQISAGHPYHKD